MFVILFFSEHNSLLISNARLRYVSEKGACIVAIAGNAADTVACVALMATLARLADDAIPFDDTVSEGVVSSAYDRRAGQRMMAAMGGWRVFKPQHQQCRYTKTEQCSCIVNMRNGCAEGAGKHA
jgi:hypothetical protein